MVDAEAQTEPTLPATVVGAEKDLLIGVRVRKSFGSRAFWGSVVGCYWVSGGLMYKVSFDDGDVDIFSADEVLQDAQAAKKHAKENPQKDKEKGPSSAVDDYFHAMRQHHLKRKRDDVVDNPLPNIRRVHLWGQRLYASIYTNEKNETFIKEMLKTEDGEVGEMEATGQVKVGDMILAVNKTRVLGMASRDLAELIRKPKRPIVLTFYRPQHSQIPVQHQHQAQGQVQASAVQTQPAQPPVPATTAQTQQPPAPVQAVPLPQPAVAVPQQQVQQAATPVMPPSFVVPAPTFAHPVSVAQNLAHQWTNASQPLTNKEIIRQRVTQNAAARQGNYVPGYPMGVYVPANAVPFRVLPAAHGGAYQTQQQQYMQRVVGTAAMSGFSGPTTQAIRPMYQPQMSIAAAQHQIKMQRNQRQRTGPTLYEKVQQMQAHRNATPEVSRQSSTQSLPSASVDASTNGAQENRVAVVGQNVPQQDASRTSRQPTPNQGSTSDQGSADNTPRESPRGSTSRSDLASSAPTSRTSLLATHDVEAITRLAETDAKAAARLMKDITSTTSMLRPNEVPADTEIEGGSHATSFLSPSALAANASKPTARETQGASHVMSFLSPNDFNAESSTPSRPGDSSGGVARRPAEVKSNISLVTVKVSRIRLYLTLGVQGTLIAVTSFVKDEFGRPGEVEKSGKVFLGDVLVRINGHYLVPGMTPNHVADIVNTVPRPMTLWFERASWDILDGKA